MNPRYTGCDSCPRGPIENPGRSSTTEFHPRESREDQRIYGGYRTCLTRRLNPMDYPLDLRDTVNAFNKARGYKYGVYPYDMLALIGDKNSSVLKRTGIGERDIRFIVGRQDSNSPIWDRALTRTAEAYVTAGVVEHDAVWFKALGGVLHREGVLTYRQATWYPCDQKFSITVLDNYTGIRAGSIPTCTGIDIPRFYGIQPAGSWVFLTQGEGNDTRMLSCNGKSEFKDTSDPISDMQAPISVRFEQLGNVSAEYN